MTRLLAAAAGCIAVAACAAPAPPDSARPFDGIWDTTLVCDRATDGALGYTFRFASVVTDNRLVGDFVNRQDGATLRLEGPIARDGSASLAANGISGDPAYQVGRTAQGRPYGYTVDARFDATRGTGRRVELRPCTVTFVRR